MGLAQEVEPEAVVHPAARAPRAAGWVLSLYPRAAEGGGCFVSSYRPSRAYVARGAARDPERAAQEAGRRARAKLRRYCAANRLTRFGTLTYAGAGEHDPLVVREHIKDFFRDLRTELGGNPLPYVWVPEWHKTDHGLHVHYAVGRYVKRATLNAAWGRGWVHIKLIGQVPVGTGAVGESRVAAGYLSKYVSKTFTDPGARVLGLHRYGVAQGFQPEKVTLRGRSPEDVLDQASGIFAMQPAKVWLSADTEGWAGPPAIWAQWAG